MILSIQRFLQPSYWVSELGVVKSVVKGVVKNVVWVVAWMLWLVLVFLYLDYRAERVDRTADSVADNIKVSVATNVSDSRADVKPVVMAKNIIKILLPPPPMLSNVKQSRLWLAALEEGQGPNIVFTWPEDTNEREWIQQRLYNCGVRLGKWRNGRLRAIEAGPETVSGFIRVFSGEVSRGEQRRLQLLAGEGRPVRLFPRSLDVYLLSQLSNVTLGQFMHAKQVSAHYAKHFGGVNIRNIQVDGKRFERSVEFLPENGRCT